MLCSQGRGRLCEGAMARHLTSFCGRRGGAVVKQLITEIVQALVDRPEQVQIKEVIGDHAHVLELSVARKIWAR